MTFLPASFAGMLIVFDFAAPLLAPGFLLAAVPIILYLLERRRTPAIDWPAMRFFLADLKRAARWMELRELLLLALRVSIIALVVTALMRPGRSLPAGAEGGGGSRGLVILLDNSYSMSRRSGEGGAARSSWEAAQAAALASIGELGPGDPVQVATLAGVPAALSERPLQNREDARAAVRGATLAGGNASIAGGLDLAAGLAAALPAGSREVRVFTDLQDRGWSLEDEARWEWVRARLGSLRPAPRLRVVDVGSPDARNGAVLELKAARPVVVTGRAVEYVARLGQFGDATPRKVAVSLSIDGEGVESRTAETREGTGNLVRFTHRIAAPGHHRLEVRQEADGFSADDVRSLALEVVEELPVLIVAGALGEEGEGPGGDGDLLELALAPRTASGSAPAPVFRPEVIDAEALDRLHAADLQRYPVVALCNVPALSPRAAGLLEDHARAGGGVSIFLGDKVSAPAYNSSLFRSGRGLLPARLLALEGTSGAPRSFLSPGKMLGDHPALAELGKGGLEDVGKARVWRWWRTEPSPGSTVIAELEGGVPFLLERSFGRGRVILVATGAGLDSSDLPRRPLFVPLAHGLIYRLAPETADRRNVALGDVLLEPLPPREVAGVPEAVDPAGRPQPASVQASGEEAGPEAGAEAGEAGGGGRLSIAHGPTLIPGFYTLKWPAAGGEGSALFAANLDPGESDLRRPRPEAFDRLASALGLTLARPEDATLQASAVSRREEWWRPFLALAVLLMALEVLFTRVLAKGRAPWRPAEKRQDQAA